MKPLLLALLSLTPAYEASYVRPEPQYEVVEATVTAYSSTKDQTWGDPYITSSGERVKKGGIACPRTLKYDTMVEIEGKNYRCNDRMNARYKNRFDIWFPSKELALDFGIKRLQVKIYK